METSESPAHVTKLFDEESTEALRGTCDLFIGPELKLLLPSTEVGRPDGDIGERRCVSSVLLGISARPPQDIHRPEPKRAPRGSLWSLEIAIQRQRRPLKRMATSLVRPLKRRSSSLFSVVARREIQVDSSQKLKLIEN